MASTSHRKAVIGSPTGSFWLYDSIAGFDLTHPHTPTSPVSGPRITMQTTSARITVRPAKTALVIIDMQNFFLSPQLGHSEDGKGLLAQRQLLEHAIPAARKAGIRIVWLNWGLTDAEVESMPPATLRAFGFETLPADDVGSDAGTGKREAAVDSHGVNEMAPEIDAQDPSAKVEIESSGKNPRIYRGLGREIGPVTLPDGTEVQGGRLLMRDAWNSALTPELQLAYEEGCKLDPPDVWIHKNRMSGLWGVSTDCTRFLERQGIQTLFFAGVNTDQCVGGSLQDAFTKGYDCVLLSDGAGTTSPSSSQESIEFNCAKTWGFCITCKAFAEGVEGMSERMSE